MLPASLTGTTCGSALAFTGLFSLPLAGLGETYRGTLPALFG